MSHFAKVLRRSSFADKLEANYVPSNGPEKPRKSGPSFKLSQSQRRYCSISTDPSRHVTVTAKVHWIRSSFLGNHANITINGSPADAGAKILAFLGPIRPGNPPVTVTDTKILHFTTLRHPSPEGSVEMVQATQFVPDGMLAKRPYEVGTSAVIGLQNPKPLLVRDVKSHRKTETVERLSSTRGTILRSQIFNI
ncbi:hypothetical protein DFH06DRAFT_1145165 [Mycena polygramma]|nr:hypothetical protein DFH06DRAFT_1145165 [Mycena polygramma]